VDLSGKPGQNPPRHQHRSAKVIPPCPMQRVVRCCPPA